MAQKQFTTFQADILSFELREALLGIARPGRFSGFDQIAADGAPSGGTIFLALSHSAAGVQKLFNGQSSLEDPIGVAVTTQGTVIHDDDVSIDIDIPDNSGSGSIRWYLVFIEHDYVEVPGANNASYGFVAGTPGSGIPALTEPYHRVILGYIRADGSATSISGLTYFPAESLSKRHRDHGQRPSQREDHYLRRIPSGSEDPGISYSIRRGPLRPGSRKNGLSDRKSSCFKIQIQWKLFQAYPRRTISSSGRSPFRRAAYS